MFRFHGYLKVAQKIWGKWTSGPGGGIQIFGAVVVRLSSMMMTRNQVAAQENTKRRTGVPLYELPMD